MSRSDVVKDLDERLREAADILNSCANILKEEVDLNRSQNVRRVAEALVNIFEIQNEIYEQRPDLKPDYLENRKREQS